MLNIEAFEAIENESKIIEGLELDGCVCVHGMRTNVRDLLGRICDYLNSGCESEEEDYLRGDYNHPYAQVGFAYHKKFSYSEAKIMAIEAYERTNI